MITNYYKTTFGLAWIVELTEPFERLEIQFMPEDIQTVRSPFVVGVNPIGRNHPFYHYLGGQDDMVISLDFYADDIRKRSVLEKVQWLKSLTYVEGQQAPVHPIKIVFGKVFQREVFVVKKVEATLRDFDLFRSLRPIRASVKLTLSQHFDRNISRSEVRSWF